MDNMPLGKLVQTFSGLDIYQIIWWHIEAVHVLWMGSLHYLDDNLYMTLLDTNRVKMIARVPGEMRAKVQSAIQIGGTYRLNYFRFVYMEKHELKYQKYHLSRAEDVPVIWFTERTKIVPIKDTVQLPLHPIAPSLREISLIDRGRYLTDVFGQICNGKKVKYYKMPYRHRVPKLEIFLLDRTAILSPKNDNVDKINNKMIERFPGEEQIYYSFDSAEDDNNNNYPIEFLNTLTPGGLPPHLLKLKKGCPIILLRNIDPANGLCNGTRLVCKAFDRNVIDAEIAVGEHAGKRVFLPRIPLCPSDTDMFPFKMKRKQFPVRLSFAMTINKAQGQTIPNVGVYLPKPVFSHGQLYVALSRGTSRANTKVLIKPFGTGDKSRACTSNVVFQEVLKEE